MSEFCVYPSPKQLANAVKKNRFPYYKMQLAKGSGQLDLRYFSDKILDHYQVHPDRYTVNEHPLGIRQRPGAFAGLSKRQRHKAWGMVRSPGVRQLANGTRAICMTVRYLSQLAADEQEYWSQFEIPQEKQDFLPDSADEAFTKWYYGYVRRKPAWESQEGEIDDDDDQD